MKKNSKVEASGQLTIGIDVSDRSSCYCYLNRQVSVRRGKIRSTPEAFRQHFGGWRGRDSAGSGDPLAWMRALLRECGA